MAKRSALLSVLVCVVFLPVVIQSAPARGGSTNNTVFRGGLVTGYYGGAGFHASIRASNFAQNFPLDFRFGIGYNKVEPGVPEAARQVFINDTTNGTPQESGHMWDFRLDLMRQVRWFNLKRAYLYGGPHHSRFTAHFEYVGGNEAFDITARQWGIGSGLDNFFALSPRVDLVLTSGFDYFFGGKLSGHDTSYSPSNENVNPREGYEYSDADKAVNQPKLELRLMFGLAYRF